MGTIEPHSEEVLFANNAPFPSEKYKAGAKEFPVLVPTKDHEHESDKNRQAWKKLKQWHKPFLTLFGDKDDIMRGAEQVFQKVIPGEQGQNHALLNAGHFIQEEKGEELARAIVEFYTKNTSNNQ